LREARDAFMAGLGGVPTGPDESCPYSRVTVGKKGNSKSQECRDLSLPGVGGCPSIPIPIFPQEWGTEGVDCT